MGQVRGDSQEEGTSQLKCEQTNKALDIEDLDLLSINSNYGEEEECHIYLAGKEILKNMRLNIKNEDLYMDQFKQLLKLEDHSKTGNKPIVSTCSIHLSNSNTVHYMVGNQDSDTDSKPSFACEKAKRLLKRQELFYHNNIFKLNVQKSYDACLELLIDLEESFTL